MINIVPLAKAAAATGSLIGDYDGDDYNATTGAWPNSYDGPGAMPDGNSHVDHRPAKDSSGAKAAVDFAGGSKRIDIPVDGSFNALTAMTVITVYSPHADDLSGSGNDGHSYVNIDDANTNRALKMTIEGGVYHGQSGPMTWQTDINTGIAPVAGEKHITALAITENTGSNWYYDGVHIGSNGNTGTLNTNLDMTFGARQDSYDGEDCLGKLYRVLVFAAHLTQAEITAEVNALKTTYGVADLTGVIVSGAGMGNGLYSEDGVFDGEPMYSKPGDEPPMTADWECKFNSTDWRFEIHGDPYWMGSNEIIYYSSGAHLTDPVPSGLTWYVHANWQGMAEPAPTSVNEI
jgi:hypothetical protein